MGYMHIENLYKDQTILEFKECYAMEKIHGTSAHIMWDPSRNSVDPVNNVVLFHGGANKEQFDALFNCAKFAEDIKDFGWADSKVTFYGEAYGGKMQGMSDTYGKQLRFVVFDVKKNDTWLAVPDAESVARRFGFDFVAYERVSTDLAALDAERDRPSRQAKKVGIIEDKPAEGVVLRPIHEYMRSDGKRIICKHKRAEFRETKHEKKVVDPAQREVLDKAEAIATEWVVPMRMDHVLDKMGNPTDLESTGKVVAAMQEDVKRESEGFVTWTKAAERAVGKAAALMYKKRCMDVVRSRLPS